MLLDTFHWLINIINSEIYPIIIYSPFVHCRIISIRVSYIINIFFGDDGRNKIYVNIIYL